MKRGEQDKGLKSPSHALGYTWWEASGPKARMLGLSPSGVLVKTVAKAHDSRSKVLITVCVGRSGVM